ncbi:MAG: branched-chain amino acid ABC transporter permease [Solirubrobacterales bacterium]
MRSAVKPVSQVTSGPIGTPRLRNLRVAATSFALCALAYVMLVRWLGQDYNLKSLTLVGPYAVATIGLALLLGITHQFNLGHAFFFALGAYVYAVLAGDDYGWSPLLASMTAVVASAVVAYGVGRILLRLEGFYFAVATLGMALIGENLLFVLRDLTGGDDGLRATELSIGGYAFDTPLRKYVLVSVILTISIVFALNLARSARGRAARAIAVDELMAGSNGVDVVGVKTQMFVISAVYASLGGVLYAAVSGYIFPSLGSVSTNLEFVVAVIVGGMGSIIGPVIVIAVLRWLPIFFERIEGNVDLVYGIILVVLLLFPEGSVRGASVRERLARRTRERTSHTCAGHGEPQAPLASPAHNEDLTT